MKNKRLIIVLVNLLLCVSMAYAEAQKSELQQRAETAIQNKKVAEGRYTYIRAFEDYTGKGQMAQAVQCGIKAVGLYYKENYWKEAFDLLRLIDNNIEAKGQSAAAKSALHYETTKERLQMYIKLRKSESAKDQLATMERFANASGEDRLKDDLLYNKAVYYYTFGQNAQGNAVFQEMANKLTAQKEYDKVDEVYKTLIDNGRRSNNASLVAKSYSSYIAWKDSVAAQKLADETGALKKQIADNETAMDKKDSSLRGRMAAIIGLGILAGALAAALVVGAVMLLRYIVLSRKQKKTIQMANESNARKAQFISNIAAQLNPTLQKLDKSKPEVKALLDFSGHVEQLSELENSTEAVELTDTPVAPFCEDLINRIRNRVKSGVTLSVDASKLSAAINKEYVEHILLHLLNNAAEYTPEGGKISLEFKKRGAHKFQFLVSNTGSTIPEELHDEIFTPFREVRDLTTGDGLGLPICRQMALKMNGELSIDPQYTRGTRFVLDLND